MHQHKHLQKNTGLRSFVSCAWNCSRCAHVRTRHWLVVPRSRFSGGSLLSILLQFAVAAFHFFNWCMCYFSHYRRWCWTSILLGSHVGGDSLTLSVSISTCLVNVLNFVELICSCLQRETIGHNSNVESVEECIATMFSVFGKPSEREQESMRIPRKQLKVLRKMPCMDEVCKYIYWYEAS